MKCIVDNIIKDHIEENFPNQRFPAVKFRRILYISAPRHADAINLAFKNMSDLTVRHISNMIADGKENMLFGWAKADGSEWEHDKEYQDARMTMYGFEKGY